MCRRSLRLFRIHALFELSLGLPLKLIRPSLSNILRPEVTVEVLQGLLDDETTGVVNDHRRSQPDLEVHSEGNQGKLLIDLRDELGGAAEGDSGNHENTVVHSAILGDGLPERPALVVDSKGGDLLDQLEEVDGGVEQARFELLSQVIRVEAEVLGLMNLDVVGDVNQCDDVNGKLSENGADDVDVEDIGLRALFRELFNGLRNVSE